VTAGGSAAALVARARAVIFDCDDTVIATARTRWPVLIGVARTFDVTLTEDAILRAWGIPFNRFIETIVPTIDHDEFVARYRAAMQVRRPEPTTGARELLAHLFARSTRMEIVTSSDRELIVQDLDALRLTGYFARIYGHEQTRHHKPDPRVLDVVVDNLGRCGYPLTDLVYIGDSVRDFQVAAARSIEFVAVLSGVEPAADFVAAGLARDRIVADLTRLLSSTGPARRAEQH